MPIETLFDRQLTVAVVGATGLVGRTMLEILTERQLSRRPSYVRSHRERTAVA